MLVILASSYDSEAVALAARYGGEAVGLLTPADLSLPGWKYQPGNVAAGSAVVNAHVVQVSAIDGVLGFLAGVHPAELHHIVPEDREYVAAEMNAFLYAWLSELPIRVMNRPAGGSLCGPAWSLERWKWAAGSIGVRISDRVHPSGATERVTVVCETAFGDVNAALKDAALRLAKAAQVELLTTTFCNGTFVSASTRADTTIDGVDAALLDAFAVSRT